MRTAQNAVVGIGLVCRKPDYEIHYVQLMITVDQTTLPLRLAAAVFFRQPWEDMSVSN